jgi:ribosomal protein S18 acetylase RimI-like enzyme
MSFRSPTGSPILFRETVAPGDLTAIPDLVRATGFFRDDEIAIAGELPEEHLRKGGEASGYFFLLADEGQTLQGYACYGPVPCTRSSYDLYWIAVAPAAQGCGLGRELLRRAEEAVRARGGTQIYIETSSLEKYASTRGFYEACGYVRVAEFPDFYDTGDAKVVFVKRLMS